MTNFTPTDRSTIRRLPKRGAYDHQTIHRILDEGLVCHIGFVVNGQPFVIPTAYARVGNQLYIHGSAASRMLKELQKGLQACVTVTLLDGLVLARSAFHHSINYRSVVAFGTASLITDPDEKMEALRTISEHLVPGRWQEVRPPSAQELKQTAVLRFSIEEASAKIRTGPPVDDEEDYDLPVWAGVIPIQSVALPPVADPRLPPSILPSSSVTEYRR